MNLNNKTAIVTGGTKGIGRAIAEALLREGVSVCIVARKQSEIDQTVSDLGGNTTGLICDVRDYDQVKALIEFEKILVIIQKSNGIEGLNSLTVRIDYLDEEIFPKKSDMLNNVIGTVTSRNNSCTS